MKKISLYIMALLTVGLSACNEDFEVTTTLQPNPQESILKASDVTFTPASVTAIDLRDVKTNDTPIKLGSVTVTDGALADGMRLQAVVQVAKAADYSDAKLLEAEDMTSSNDICILPSKLHELYTNDFTLDPNATTLYLRTNLYTVIGEESKASIGNPQTTFYGTYNVAFTPYDDGVRISNAYYAIVKNFDGSYSEIKCTHQVDEEDPITNVYDNPVFTVEIPAIKDGSGVRHDTPYAFVSEEDLSKYKTDASVLFGESQEMNKMEKGGAFFVGPASDDAYKYVVTLDMKNLTIITDPEILFFCYYLYPNSTKGMKIDDSETNKHYMFYKNTEKGEDGTIDETKFTYTTYWPGDASSLPYLIKFWERVAMNAKNESALWGFNGKAKGERPLSGPLKQPGQWLGPQTQGWFTLTIHPDEENLTGTYEFKEIAAPTTEYTNISITVDGADVDLAECKSAPHNWCLLNYELTEDTQIKFRANHADTKVWGGDGSQKISQVVYALPAGTENITVPAGTYDFYLNDITGQWSILKVKK